jgi:Virulence-associated protein E/RepB DNA-primase from phage plasmid
LDQARRAGRSGVSAAEAQSEIVPDYAAAIDFLSHFAPGERWTLVAIEPDPAIGRTARCIASHFDGESVGEAMQWMERHCAWNLYFTTYEAAASVGTTPEKHQLTALRCLHVDLDLPRSGKGDLDALLRRIRSADPPPTAIVFSGGGYQAIWRFPENLDITEILRVEAACRDVAQNMGGDHCWNCNRLLRLPGSINRLSPKKRRDGRIPALACLVEADWTRTWSFDSDQIPTAAIAAETAEEQEEEEPATHGKHHIDDLPPKLRKLIKTGDASQWNGDRSRAVFYIVCMAVRAGWSDENIIAMLLDADNGISRHVHEQSRPAEYAARQAKQARAAVAEDWERTTIGVIIADSQKNARRALSEMGVALRYDEFAMRLLVDGDQIDDAIGNHLRFAISDRFGFRPSKDFFFDYLGELAREDTFHPVRDYLDGVAWDGTPRIGDEQTKGWLTTYGGAEDSAYVRAVSRLVLVGAVRRVRQPGCKFDTMLVLVNPDQGTEKSSAVTALAVRQEWFNGNLQLNMRAREVIEQIAGKWIVELSDLAGWRRAEIEQVKAFLSLQIDRARHAYGHFPGDVPRSCIMIGTTNRIEFLKDTQNRRFWPVRVRRFDIGKLIADRDQLWAEAAAAEAAGEPIQLDAKLWDAAGEVQGAHREVDPWFYVMEAALAGFTDCRISTAHLFDIMNLPNGVKNSSMSSRLADVMRALGWNDNGNKVMRVAGRVCAGWRLGNGEEHLVVGGGQIMTAAQVPNFALSGV